MSSAKTPLFDLLPAIHRLRDVAQGDPLRTLLGIVEDEVAVLEEGLEQFYDDQFIETCADWVVPYIGDLIGYRSLHHNVPSLGSPRAEVANTIAYRRRKGTVAMLEQLGRDVTGWPCKVVEFFELLQTTQFMNHPRPHSHLTPDLRKAERIDSIDTAFDRQAHSVDTRSITWGNGLGRYNIPHLGLYLWRIGAHPLSASPAVAVDAQRFHIHPLGIDAPLFRRPETEPSIEHLAERANVPLPISRWRMWEDPGAFFGDGLSVEIAGVAPEALRVCDLSGDGGTWAHTPPPAGIVAIDPVLGRLAYGTAPEAAPRVSFHYGTALTIGGGEYGRAETFTLPAEPAQTVTMPASLQAALDARTPGTPLEITDNGRYEESLTLALAPGERFELRAADERRPTLVLGGDLVISGGDEHAEVSLNGLLLAGGTLRLTGEVRRLRLRHCTLVPGLSLTVEGEPTAPTSPSLVIETGGVTVEISHSILGGVRLHPLSRLEATDSIVDATDSAGVAFASCEAPPEGEAEAAGGTLRLEECTVVGKVHAAQVELVSNSILDATLGAGDPWPAPVRVERKQTGCVRFSYVPDGARTPRRYRCQPELEISTRLEAARRALGSPDAILPEADRAAIRAEVLASLKPAFTSLRLAHPGYGQLRSRCPRQLREGAEDEAAMGATHDLYEPQRLTNLRIRLEEYLRFGLEAGVFLAS